jgi:hypothetical protein
VPIPFTAATDTNGYVQTTNKIWDEIFATYFSSNRMVPAHFSARTSKPNGISGK